MMAEFALHVLMRLVARVNVPGNMDIEDFVEDLKFYQDPDYSGILPEEGNEPDDGEDSETQ